MTQMTFSVTSKDCPSKDSGTRRQGEGSASLSSAFEPRSAYAAEDFHGSFNERAAPESLWPASKRCRSRRLLFTLSLVSPSCLGGGASMGQWRASGWDNNNWTTSTTITTTINFSDAVTTLITTMVSTGQRPSVWVGGGGQQLGLRVFRGYTLAQKLVGKACGVRGLNRPWGTLGAGSPARGTARETPVQW